MSVHGTTALLRARRPVTWQSWHVDNDFPKVVVVTTGASRQRTGGSWVRSEALGVYVWLQRPGMAQAESDASADALFANARCVAVRGV